MCPKIFKICRIAPSICECYECASKLYGSFCFTSRNANGVIEVLWLKKLMTEIRFSPKLPTQLTCDNKAVISISKNKMQHDRTKHVEVDQYFIKEEIEEGIF